jgi:hypothetical protein
MFHVKPQPRPVAAGAWAESAKGRPEREYRSAKHEGTPVIAFPEVRIGVESALRCGVATEQEKA